MKKIFAFILMVAVLMSCVACSANPVKVENEKVEQTVTETLEVETDNNAETDAPIVNSSDVLVKTVNNADDICEYLNFVFESAEFDVMHKIENYYDEYFSMDIQEYAYIAGVDADGFEMIGLTSAFVGDKLVDFTASLNTTEKFDIEAYKDTVNTLCSIVGYNLGMSKSEVAEMVAYFYTFEGYIENVYGNLQLEFENSNAYCSCVIFEGGKDFEYDGVTYYFIISPKV